MGNSFGRERSKTTEEKKRLVLKSALTILSCVAVFGVATYGFWARADVVEYHAGSCLGNWERVENVLGEPELENVDVAEFSIENSARFPGGDAQIFCGNFSGEESRKWILRGARLSFAWAFIPKDETPTPSSESVLEVPPSPENVSSTPPLLDQETTSTSWFGDWFPIAHAETTEPVEIPATDSGEAPRTEPSTPPEEVGVAPIEDGPPEPHNSSSQVELLEEAKSSSSLEIPFDLATPPSSDNFVTSISANDILQISFSLDGINWVALGTVDENSWREASFELNISSWEELRKLQVGIKGLPGAFRMRDIYLDGVRVEVEAETPDFLKDLFSEVNYDIAPKPPVEEVDVAATHHCTVEPFSQSIKGGGSLAYVTTLFPSADGLPYTTLLGGMPAGSEGALTHASSVVKKMIESVAASSRSTSSATSTILLSSSSTPTSTEILYTKGEETETGPTPIPLALTLTVDKNAAPGSYSLVLTYKETKEDRKVVANYCQYNLIIE